MEFLTIEQEQLCYENDSPPFFYHNSITAATRLKKVDLKHNKQIVNLVEKMRPLTRSLIDKPESVKVTEQKTLQERTFCQKFVLSARNLKIIALIR